MKNGENQFQSRERTEKSFGHEWVFHSRVGVHGVATRGREGRVQSRRDADDDHVSSGVDRFSPVSDHGVVAPGIEGIAPFPRRLDEIVAPNSQVHMHEALALGSGLPFLYELLRQGALREEPESVPNAGVRDNRSVSGWGKKRNRNH